MTAKEQAEAMAEARKKFFAWEPPAVFDPFRSFRCRLIQPYPVMKEEQCRRRAETPELYDCTNKCPRWRHYRKLVKKAAKKDGYERTPYLKGDER